MRVLVLALMVVGCGGSGSDSEDEQQMNLVCERSDREGIFFWAFQTVDGDCGDFDSGISSLEDGPGCTVHRDEWSENDCKRSRDFTCVFQSGTGYAVTTEIIEQMDANGDRFEGIESTTVRDSSDGFICAGTYRFTLERQ